MSSGKGANAVAVAEHAFALMLGLARRIVPAATSVAEGRWEKSRLGGIGLRGKTLGIVGFGSIGTEIARIASAMGMNVVVAPSTVQDPRNDSRRAAIEGLPCATEASSLVEALELSDFVSVQLPLTEGTRDLIGRAELSSMKPSGILVSVGRGGVVNEAALLDSLRGRDIYGAALDVFVNEGPRDMPADETLMKLAALDSTIITPHIGGHTGEAQEEVWNRVVENALDALR